MAGLHSHRGPRGLARRGDLVVARKASPARPPRPLPAALRFLDRNGDGKIDRRDFLPRWLDRDGDGRISSSDALFDIKRKAHQAMRSKVEEMFISIYVTRLKPQLTPDRRMPWVVRRLIHDVANDIWEIFLCELPDSLDALFGDDENDEYVDHELSVAGRGLRKWHASAYLKLPPSAPPSPPPAPPSPPPPPSRLPAPAAPPPSKFQKKAARVVISRAVTRRLDHQFQTLVMAGRLKVPSALLEDADAPSARLVPPRAPAAPAQSSAPPEQPGSLPWLQQLASARSQDQPAATCGAPGAGAAGGRHRHQPAREPRARPAARGRAAARLVAPPAAARRVAVAAARARVAALPLPAL